MVSARCFAHPYEPRRCEPPRSQQHSGRVFDEGFERGDKLGAERAIDGTVIGRERGLICVAMTILPSRTTGRSSPAPMAMMLACGGLITASNSSIPYMPRLETAEVPP